jgi:hypothetical protein
VSPQDNNPSVRVHDEPEDERPLGTGEEIQPDLAGMAIDPYAEDLLYDFRYRRLARRRWIVVSTVAVLLAAAALAVFILVRLF